MTTPVEPNTLEARALYVVAFQTANLPVHWALVVAHSDQHANLFQVLGGPTRWTKDERHCESLPGRADVCMIMRIPEPAQVRLRDLQIAHHDPKAVEVDNKSTTWTSQDYVIGLLRHLQKIGKVSVRSFELFQFEMDRQLASSKHLRQTRKGPVFVMAQTTSL